MDKNSKVEAIKELRRFLHRSALCGLWRRSINGLGLAIFSVISVNSLQLKNLDSVKPRLVPMVMTLRRSMENQYKLKPITRQVQIGFRGQADLMLSSIKAFCT